MRRREFLFTSLAATALGVPLARAANGVGIVLLHGKNPGGPTTSRQLGDLLQAFQSAGCAAEMPNMPWSLRRYIDGSWTKAMDEIGAALAAQRATGARFVVLAGQSLGTAAALSYAALRGDVDALVLTAPGHVPRQYYESPMPYAVLVRQSVDEARSLVAQGFGQNMGRWSDINQGNTMSVSMRAADYLSYFDPNGDAEMANVAPKVPARIPVLMVVGNRDDAAQWARRDVFSKLPPHARSQYLEVRSDHLNTPAAAKDDVVRWVMTLPGAA